MTARRFKLTFDDGSEFFCAAFESEGAREQAIAGVSIPAIEPFESAAEEQPRPRGRPSFDAVIAEAVQTLQLEETSPLAERARCVLKYLAETCSDPADIPNARTVERHLAKNASTTKSTS